MLRNTAAFITAFLISAAVICYAVCITVLHPDAAESFFSLKENGDIVFMGKIYTPDPDAASFAFDYLSACRRMNNIFIPNFLTAAAKKTAAALAAAASDAVCALHSTAKHIIFGYM